MNSEEALQEAEIAYRQAEKALSHCCLTTASEKYKKAAASYLIAAEKVDPHKQRDSLCLNAMVCLFKAGEYTKASMVYIGINLTPDESKLKDQLAKDISNRLRGSYWDDCSHRLKSMSIAKDYKGILAFLKNEPYVVKSKDYAIHMRNACIALGMKEISELFQKDYETLRKRELKKKSPALS